MAVGVGCEAVVGEFVCLGGCGSEGGGIGGGIGWCGW